MNFAAHIKGMAAKAAVMTASLGQLLSNVWGSKPIRRKILGSVAHSIILYAAPVWEGALATEKNRKILASVQSKMAMSVCSAYRTVSEDAVLVVAGIPSINLLAMQRTLLKRERDRGNKVKEREWLMEQWQQQWKRGMDKAAHSSHRTMVDKNTWGHQLPPYTTAFWTWMF